MTRKLSVFLFLSLLCCAMYGQTDSPEFTNALKKAKDGDYNAMCDVAMMYHKGIGTKQDAKEAIYWYKKAYKTGGSNTESMATDMCQLYLEEYGLENTELFIKEFFPNDKGERSQMLGSLYMSLLEKDMIFTSDNQERLKKAIGHFEDSYKKGNEKAVKFLPTLCLKLNEKDYIKAKKYYDIGIVGWSPSGNDFKDAVNCPIADRLYVEQQLKPYQNEADNAAALRNPEAANDRKDYTKKPTYNPNYRLYITHNIIGNGKENRKKLPWNSPEYRYTVGISLGYVHKLFVTKENGNTTTHGWRKDFQIPGIQAGVRFNPQLKHGFGFDTGVFYEFYYEPTAETTVPSKYGTTAPCKATFQEHDLYVPAHAEYSVHLGRKFRLFAAAGLGLNFCLSATDSYQPLEDGAFESITIKDAYAEEGYKTFLATLEYGGGLSIETFQLRLMISKGLNSISKGSTPDTKVNKLSVAMSLQF
ncbi:MAG: sel1 repeat family protein [Prevotella sp.]|nr:sel1 repeat family protein [Prevotella sp.]